MSHATANTVEPAASHNLIPILNQLLAESLASYTHAKQAHWNVRGPQFISLHELFDKVAQGILAMSDDLAERAVQLGGEASGTLKQAASASKLPAFPAPKKMTPEIHIKAVVDMLAYLSQEMREGITAADDAGDAVTADMLTTMTAELDKNLWFAESHLL